MEEQIKLTREQVISLTFLGIIGNIVYTHTWMDDFTDRSAWVAAFLGILGIIPMSVWLFILSKYSSQATVFGIIERGLGKIISKAMGLLFILINIGIAVTHLNMFTQMLNVFFLQSTPPWVIMLFLTVICLIFTQGGIQAFGRLTILLGIIGVLNFFAAFIFAFPNFIHLEYIFPIFDTTWAGFFKGVLFITGTTAEGLLLLMIIVRYIPDPGKHFMWAVKGIALSSIVIPFAIFMIMAIMSPELAKRVSFGAVNAARIIQIGDFIQGLEVFTFVSYQFLAIGKITLSMYCAWIAGKEVFTLKKPIIQLLIIWIIILIPSVWLSSYNTAYALAVYWGRYILLPYCLTVLILTTISVVIQNRRAGSAAK